ncbi:hypothetical protein VDGL01_09224 [Verticillium dahliae]
MRGILGTLDDEREAESSMEIWRVLSEAWGLERVLWRPWYRYEQLAGKAAGGQQPTLGGALPPPSPVNAIMAPLSPAPRYFAGQASGGSSLGRRRTSVASARPRQTGGSFGMAYEPMMSHGLGRQITGYDDEHRAVLWKRGIAGRSRSDC